MEQFFSGRADAGMADGTAAGGRDGVGTGHADAGLDAMPPILAGSLRDRFRTAAENPDWGGGLRAGWSGVGA
ncbi:hypothetical protein [Streptomyces sp. NPDC005336]|uniref:hypothetical protein n=1 Tax=unclassified Streptomyces TaxID=2593676 RepID=UPI0033AC25F7